MAAGADVAAWAGEWGFVAHVNSQYRGPAFSGDVTFFNATVTGTGDALDPAMGEVRLTYTLTNQRDETLAKGSGEVLLPRS